MEQSRCRYEYILSASTAIAIILASFSPAKATVETDIVFLVDRSISIETCLFDFEANAISALICGGDCTTQNCTDVILPHDGTVAITVIRFGRSIGGPEVAIDKVVVDATAPTLCQNIRNLTRPNVNSSTSLASALVTTKQELEERIPAPPNRVVIILTDARSLSELDGDPRGVASELRNLAGTPARISAFRMSDSPFGPDDDCAEPVAEEILEAIPKPIRVSCV